MSSELTEIASNQLMKVSMRRTGLTLTKSDRLARGRLADADGVAEDQYRVSKVLLPKGYDGEWNALKGALNKAYTEFMKTTMPFGVSASGKSADGARVVHVDQIMPQEGASWISVMSGYSREIAQKREEFALALPGVLSRLSTDPKYQQQFDESQYPTPEQIRESFKFVIDGPEPIGRFDYIPLTGKMGAALATRFDTQIASRVSFGQQQVAKELLHYVKTLGDNLSALSGHADAPDSPTKGKAPRIYDSLTTNLEHIVIKARQFALAGTAEGAALLELADRVRLELVPEGRTSSDFKANVPLARATAKKAAQLASDVESMELFWD